eukprot:363696-Chlamydomonas_euryale.AAC.23
MGGRAGAWTLSGLQARAIGRAAAQGKDSDAKGAACCARPASCGLRGRRANERRRRAGGAEGRG